MEIKISYRYIVVVFIALSLWGCKVPQGNARKENKSVPERFYNAQDSANAVQLNWRAYFSDVALIALIDTALKNNQELNITRQEIEISKNEIRARKGEYLPFVGIAGSLGLEKEGRFTRQGAVEESLQIKPGTAFPHPLSDYMFGAYASWEVDVWKKLHNAKKAAVARYLASIEGRNFMVTNLIAEIADAYYELLANDNLLDIIQKNIEIQNNALQIVKHQKDAARVTQLAVNRFEAQLLNTQNLQYEIKQRIVETENRIHFLTGRFPQNIPRNAAVFLKLQIDSIPAGIPSQLLVNRPDIRQAELELSAAKLDIKAARANFYPSFRITSGVGFQAFNPMFLMSPESMIFNLAGDMVAPLINRNAIKTQYYSANALQIQAVYNYEQTILNAYLEIRNQMGKIDNYLKSYNTKSREVEILNQSINISNSIFNSARADYAEVLLTQREALEAKIDLLEIKKKQLEAKVNIYRSLGGGWQ